MSGWTPREPDLLDAWPAWLGSPNMLCRKNARRSSMALVARLVQETTSAEGGDSGLEIR
jgi:hypothetical protein